MSFVIALVGSATATTAVLYGVADAIGLMREEHKDTTYRRVNALRRMGRAYGSWEVGA